MFGKSAYYGCRAASQAQLLLCERESVPREKTRRDHGGSLEGAEEQFPGQDEELCREMDTVYSIHLAYLAFNFSIAKKCFYPFSALTTHLPLAPGASTGSVIREHTGKELHAGKLPLDGYSPPPSLCRWSTGEAAVRAGGEGLLLVSYMWLPSSAIPDRQDLCCLFF